MGALNTRDFYKQLEDDYKEMVGRDKDRGKGNDNTEKMVRQSFLYHYFKKKKDADVNPERTHLNRELLFSTRDKYTRLKRAAAALERKIITKEEYRGIFIELNDKVKKREELLDTDPQAAQEQLEDRLLKAFIDDFLHNAKVRAKKMNAYDPVKGAYIDEIEMLYEYYKYAPSVSFAASSDLSDDYIKKCAALYEIVRADDKWAKCFIPLYIDKDSGAGVYIVGKSIFDMDEVTETKVCVLMFDSVYEADEPYLPIDMIYTIYDDIWVAFEEFKNGVEANRYFNEYSERNGNKPPKDADECFRSRFFNNFSTENWGWRDEVIEEYNENESKGIEEMKEYE